MIDLAPAEFVLPVSPTAEVDAHEAFARVLTGEAAVLQDRAMLLISGLLTSEEDRPLTGDEIIAVKVITSPDSIRIEITDAGSGVVLGGLRKPRHLATKGWSPHLLSRIADRWGLVSGSEGAWVWFELDLPLGADG
ncbi:MAG TPA: hypothetical protein VMR89_09190 [Actinomycetota bacterium]|nr:hypothetical protein [Actinomycetota bacterium]